MFTAHRVHTCAVKFNSDECFECELNHCTGISDMQNKFMPEKCKSFACDKNWMSISGGQHHTLALDGAGM